MRKRRVLGAAIAALPLVAGALMLRWTGVDAHDAMLSGLGMALSTHNLGLGLAMTAL